MMSLKIRLAMRILIAVIFIGILLAVDWEVKAQSGGMGSLWGFDEAVLTDDPVTVAQISAVINKIMKYKTTDKQVFSDVEHVGYIEPGSWFYVPLIELNGKDILDENAGMENPDRILSREEAVVIIARTFKLNTNISMPSFIDAADISPWAGMYVAAMQNYGYLSCFESRFRPGDNFTWGHLNSILRAIIRNYLNEAMTFTKLVYGNVLVGVPGAAISRAKINGDLYITPGVGTGGFKLDNTLVKGRLIIQGGGPHSVEADNSKILGRVIIDNDISEVRLAIDEGSEIGAPIEIYSDTILEGDFGEVIIKGSGVKVSIRGNVEVLRIGASDGVITVEKNGNIEVVYAESDNSEISGEGTARKININADNVVIKISNALIIISADAYGVLVGSVMIPGGEIYTVNSTGTDIIRNASNQSIGENGAANAESGNNSAKDYDDESGNYKEDNDSDENTGDAGDDEDNGNNGSDDGGNGNGNGNNGSGDGGNDNGDNSNGDNNGGDSNGNSGGDNNKDNPAYINVYGISLNKSSTRITVGAEEQLEAFINPVNAINKKVYWTSSDAGIADVNASGLVKAVSAGAAVITAITEDGGYYADCIVNAAPPIIDITDILITGIAVSSVQIMTGGAVGYIDALIIPSDTNQDNSVIWSWDESRVPEGTKLEVIGNRMQITSGHISGAAFAVSASSVSNPAISAAGTVEIVGAQTYMIRGWVSDADTNSPIVGALINLSNGYNRYSGFTNRNGEYSIEVVGGRYSGTVAAEGYNESAIEEFEIKTDSADIGSTRLQSVKGGVKTYQIVIAKNEFAAISSDPAGEAAENEAVRISIIDIQNGKRFASIKVIGSNNELIPTTELDTGKEFSFIMPACDVTAAIFIRDDYTDILNEINEMIGRIIAEYEKDSIGINLDNYAKYITAILEAENQIDLARKKGVPIDENDGADFEIDIPGLLRVKAKVKTFLVNKANEVIANIRLIGNSQAYEELYENPEKYQTDIDWIKELAGDAELLGVSAGNGKEHEIDLAIINEIKEIIARAEKLKFAADAIRDLPDSGAIHSGNYRNPEISSKIHYAEACIKDAISLFGASTGDGSIFELDTGRLTEVKTAVAVAAASEVKAYIAGLSADDVTIYNFAEYLSYEAADIIETAISYGASIALEDRGKDIFIDISGIEAFINAVNEKRGMAEKLLTAVAEVNKHTKLIPGDNVAVTPDTYLDYKGAISNALRYVDLAKGMGASTDNPRDKFYINTAPISEAENRVNKARDGAVAAAEDKIKILNGSSTIESPIDYKDIKAKISNAEIAIDFAKRLEADVEIDIAPYENAVRSSDEYRAGIITYVKTAVAGLPEVVSELPVNENQILYYDICSERCTGECGHLRSHPAFANAYAAIDLAKDLGDITFLTIKTGSENAKMDNDNEMGDAKADLNINALHLAESSIISFNKQAINLIRCFDAELNAAANAHRPKTGDTEQFSVYAGNGINDAEESPEPNRISFVMESWRESAYEKYMLTLLEEDFAERFIGEIAGIHHVKAWSGSEDGDAVSPIKILDLNELNWLESALGDWNINGENTAAKFFANDYNTFNTDGAKRYIRYYVSSDDFEFTSAYEITFVDAGYGLSEAIKDTEANKSEVEVKALDISEVNGFYEGVISLKANTYIGELTLTGGVIVVDDGVLLTLASNGLIKCPITIADGGRLDMSGGKISGNSRDYGAGVIVDGGGKFYMTDGEIAGNISTNSGGGVMVTMGGEFNMSGGRIYNNSAMERGGGVYITGGYFIMSGGEISGNSVTGGYSMGGGVYVDSTGLIISEEPLSLKIFEDGTDTDKAHFIMDGGLIKDNYATYGGGLCIYNSFAVMNGGIISENKAKSRGCGVEIRADGTDSEFIMYGGDICSNRSSSDDAYGAAYGAGVHVIYTGSGITDERAYFEMNGGNICCNKGFLAGGVCISANKKDSRHSVFTHLEGIVSDNNALIGPNICIYDRGTYNNKDGSFTSYEE